MDGDAHAIVAAAARGMILCGCDAQRDLVERGARELHFAREKLFRVGAGGAGGRGAGAGRARDKGSPGDVALTILGVPPAQIVVPWEDAATRRVRGVRDADESGAQAHLGSYRATVAARPYTLAWAAAKAVKSAIGRSRESCSAFVGPDDTGEAQQAAALRYGWV